MESVPLRPYQLKAIEAIRRIAMDGAKRILLVAPTGSGKTRTAAELARLCAEGGRATVRRVLWLAHRAELIEQASQRLAAEGVENGIIAPWAKAKNCSVQVASIQTLLSRGQFPEADLVIADEAHHMVAEQWNTVPAAYPKSFIVGLTATPERADGTALGNLFEALHTVAKPKELIALGHLVPVQVWAPHSIPKGALGAPVVEAWQRHAKGLRTIVFATHVNHAAELAKRFCEAGETAECVDGEMDHEIRKSAIRRFERGETRVLTNVYVLTEGFDVPGVECVVLAHGFSACSTYIQAVGRAMRPAKGKTCAIVLDLKGAVHQHGMPDDDRQYSLEGDPIKRGDKSEPIRQCKRCGAVFSASVRECPRCGFMLPKLASPEERKAKLEAIRRVASLDDKRMYLEQMERVARSKGYNAGWSAHMFKARFGHFPDRRLWSAA